MVATLYILRKLVIQQTIEKYGRWLERISDARVTNATTAEVFTNNALNNPSYNAEVRVLISEYDISSINIGDMVQFKNTDELTESLLLQVVRIDRDNEFATIYLDTFIPYINERVNSLSERLDRLETLANPDTVI